MKIHPGFKKIEANALVDGFFDINDDEVDHVMGQSPTPTRT